MKHKSLKNKLSINVRHIAGFVFYFPVTVQYFSPTFKTLNNIKLQHIVTYLEITSHSLVTPSHLASSSFVTSVTASPR